MFLYPIASPVKNQSGSDSEFAPSPPPKKKAKEDTDSEFEASPPPKKKTKTAAKPPKAAKAAKKKDNGYKSEEDQFDAMVKKTSPVKKAAISDDNDSDFGAPEPKKAGNGKFFITACTPKSRGGGRISVWQANTNIAM